MFVLTKKQQQLVNEKITALNLNVNYTPTKAALKATEEKYSRLQALCAIGKDKHNNSYWLFRCDCGSDIVARLGDVKSGRTQSCGCHRRETSAELSKARRKYPVQWDIENAETRKGIYIITVNGAPVYVGQTKCNFNKRC